MWWLLVLGCQTPPPRGGATLVPAAPGAVAPASEVPTRRGGTVYVPVYSSVFQRAGDTFDLTVMLSVRNADPEHALTVQAIRFHDRAGGVIQAFVEQPAELAPLASLETLVPDHDTRAGVGGSFLVEWRAADPVVDPVVEAVMIGTAHQQGISFITAGHTVRVVGDEGR